jgi:GT2 family glycosyltransferase
MKLVSIITVNYNHSHLTEALIESIRNTNDYPAIEIVVVDNGSNLNPVPEWQDKYPHVVFIRSDKNLGFAGGNNLGINNAQGDYLFLVNNDTEFTPGLIGSMVQYMDKDERIGVASPKICYYEQPERLQYVGYTPMNYYTCRNACIGQYQQDVGQYDAHAGDTAYAHGAAMMIRREVISKAGFMPENYFLYYEELDWCERIRRAGYSITINTQALIYHKESMSVGKQTLLKEYFMNRNRILFIRRNATPLACTVFYCYFFTMVVPRNVIVYIRNKQFGFIKALAKAIWWNITHRSTSNDLGYTFN